jgi:hypothetical protein
MALIYNSNNPPKKEWGEDYSKALTKVIDEEEDVKRKRARLAEVAYEKTQKESPSTRASLSNIPESSRYFCNTHTTECMQDAGITIAGNVSKDNPYKGYTGGEKFPTIPGNIKMDGFAKRTGWKWVDNPEEGDLVREQIFKNSDYQGNTFKPKYVSSHSLIYGYDENGNAVHFNSLGGKRNSYTSQPASYLEDDAKSDENMRLRYMRYYGNLDRYNEEKDKARAELKNQDMPKAKLKKAKVMETNTPREIKGMSVFNKYLSKI